MHVGFGRWPIERCLQDEKSHLGLSHFEVRNYQSLCRHLFITQVSHLFLAQETCRLRKKNPQITICQVREAVDGLIAALPLSAKKKRSRLNRLAEILQRTQRRNVCAKRCHAKTRKQTLQQLGINLEQLRCCIPP